MKIKDMSPEGQRAYRYARKARLNLNKALAEAKDMPPEHPLAEAIEEIRQVAQAGIRSLREKS